MSSLSLQLSNAQQYSSSVLQPCLTEAEVRVAALEAELASARAERNRAAVEVAQVMERITGLRAQLEPVTTAPARIWSVSDCHSHSYSGSWGLEATESGTYGVCVDPSKSEGANITMSLVTGEKVEVSKKRYNVAKDIRIGDTLYMGDKKRRAVFKGTVVGQSVPGLFKSEDPSIQSFRRHVGERVEAAGKSDDFAPLSEQLELMWEVKWERVATLTAEWKVYLKFSHRSSVRPLSSTPNF
jgi:hypothetical protein